MLEEKTLQRAKGVRRKNKEENKQRATIKKSYFQCKTTKNSLKSNFIDMT